MQTTTLAILKTVKSPPPKGPAAPAPEDAKENKKLSPKSSPLSKSAGSPASPKSESRYNIFPRSERLALPCAQYKTEKGYKCPNCQRCYNARKNLVRHVTLECGRDPQYRCPYCAYCKHRRNELKKHVEKKHPDRRPLSPARATPDPSPAPAAPPQP